MTAITQTELSMNLSVNQTICGCDGAITIVGNGGTKPYTYSINNGLTYGGMPVFNNLCSGVYTPIIIDASGRTKSQVITLSKPSDPTTYNISLQTSSSVGSNNGSTLTKSYNSKVIVSPPLPNGVSITFDLNHLNNFLTSPNSGSSTNTTNTILYKNSSIVSGGTNYQVTGQSINTLPGCQNKFVSVISTYDVWNSITITNADDINMMTVTTITKNESDNCYIGKSDETYMLVNPKIYGCACCNVTTS